MKTRVDFVSNSSSASFVVITDKGAQAAPPDEWRGGKLLLPDFGIGQACFDWDSAKYRSVGDKLNWCAIIARSKSEQEKYDGPEDELREQVFESWMRYGSMVSLLKKTCAKRGFDVDIKPEDWYLDECGYIDHQSDVGESPENARMFKSGKTLEDFLFNEGSYIDCSNDNDGRDNEDYDYNTGRWSSQPDDYYVPDAPYEGGDARYNEILEPGQYDGILDGKTEN